MEFIRVLFRSLTTARKASSSRIYSVALRRKGLAILAVPVPAPEKGTHGRPFLALRLGPEERNAVIGRVMLEDERQRAFGIAPLHVCLIGLVAMLLKTDIEVVVVIFVAEGEHRAVGVGPPARGRRKEQSLADRSEEHTSELQS